MEAIEEFSAIEGIKWALRSGQAEKNPLYHWMKTFLIAANGYQAT